MKPFFSPLMRRCTVAALVFGASANLLAPLQAQDAAPNTAANNTAPTTTSVLTADAVQEAFVRVAQRIRPSVVSIESQRNPPGQKAKAAPPKPGAKGKPAPAPAPDEGEEEFDPEMPSPFGPRDPNERPRSMGTGMVIREDGYVLTNYHVVKGASFIRVVFDPDTEQAQNPAARLVGYDEESDLAVLKLLKPRPGLQAVQFADSDKVRIGEWAIAVGAPFEQAQSVTVGIVSARNRHLQDKNGATSLQDYLQTDASINPGNSGGPLVNLDGKIIGVNTAILSPSRYNIGIGFSVPSNSVRAYLPRLMNGKPIERGYLGIQYMRLKPEVAREFGVESGMHIGSLARDEKKVVTGPAKAAGLQTDDIITAVDGKKFDSSDEFRSYVSNQPPGTKLTLSIARPTGTDVEKKEVVLTLGRRPGKSPNRPLPVNASGNTSRLGMEIQDADKLSGDERTLFNFDPKLRGAVITDIMPGSPADEAQVRRGLRIVRVRINGGAWQAVNSKAAFARVEKSLPAGARVLMQLKDRDDTSVYDVLVVPEVTKAA